MLVISLRASGRVVISLKAGRTRNMLQWGCADWIIIRSGDSLGCAAAAE